MDIWHHLYTKMCEVKKEGTLRREIDAEGKREKEGERLDRRIKIPYPGD